jgi:hypothetical protein
MIKKILKKIPFIKNELKRVKPAGVDEVIDNLNIQNHCLFIDIGANTGQTIRWLLS